MEKLEYLTIYRFCMAEFGTFGEYLLDGMRFYTVERPWLNNQTSVSCIPEGTYQCKHRLYHRGGYHAIEILNVPGRTHILFHKANLPDELAGCIAPVSRLGIYKGKWAGLSSKNSFDYLMDRARGVNPQNVFRNEFPPNNSIDFTLTIKNGARDA